jgi:hypothetical protein
MGYKNLTSHWNVDEVSRSGTRGSENLMKRITNIPGYANPDMFLVILNYIKSESYKKMSLKEYWDSRR